MPFPPLGIRHGLRDLGGYRRGRRDVTRRVSQPERRRVHSFFPHTSFLQYTSAFRAFFEVVHEIKYNNDGKWFSYRFGASRFDTVDYEKNLVNIFAVCYLKFDFRP